jgi:hypothetical protein
MSKLAGWDPVSAGREAGRREREQRYGKARNEQLRRQREWQEFMGRKADNGGKEPPLTEPEPSVIPEQQRPATDVAERFMAEVTK